MCQDERIKEACGVFGIYNPHGEDAASSIYYGLSSLQHRGQESCGIAVFDTSGPKGNMNVQRGMGLVSEVFKEDVLSNMKGNLGIGHVRYSTTGAATLSNAQPLVLNYIKGPLALAHNGNLVNTEELRNELAQNGAIFHTTTDSEVIAYYIARERVRTKSVEEAIMKTAEKIKGAYSLIVQFFENLLYLFFMICICGTDELVIGCIHQIPDSLDLCGYVVYVFLRGDACFFGFQLDLLTMLVSTGLEEYIVSLLSFEAGDTVCQYDLVGITDMGLAGCVGNRRCHIKFFFCHCLFLLFLS